jgi:hypothetical protein
MNARDDVDDGEEDDHHLRCRPAHGQIRRFPIAGRKGKVVTWMAQYRGKMTNHSVSPASGLLASVDQLKPPFKVLELQVKAR